MEVVLARTDHKRSFWKFHLFVIKSWDRSKMEFSNDLVSQSSNSQRTQKFFGFLLFRKHIFIRNKKKSNFDVNNNLLFFAFNTINIILVFTLSKIILSFEKNYIIQKANFDWYAKLSMFTYVFILRWLWDFFKLLEKRLINIF